MSRNGLINILFEEAPAAKPKDKRDMEQYHLDKFVQEGVFIPRGRLKHVRIIKVAPIHGKPLHCNLKRMFVDGCHLNELIPRRQILSQNYQRYQQRSQSPEMKANRQTASPPQQRSLFQGRLRELLEKEAEERDSLYATVQPTRDRQKEDSTSVEQSTASSSFRYIKPRLSIRSRKIAAEKEQKEADTSLSLRKNIFKTCSKPCPPPENISAKAYMVVQHFCNPNNPSPKVIHATFSSKICLEIASLTKIMTCVIAMETCQRNGVDLEKTEVAVGQMETKVQGTTAELQIGEVYTIWQLLHGMMLPSGNDASLALAAYCGGILLKQKQRQKDKEKAKQEDVWYKKNRVKQFVAEMNRKALELHMNRTNYSNTHGLASTLNKSCASDQVILIDYALRHPLFRKIVGCKLFSSWTIAKEGLPSKQLQWQFCPYYYSGIKTGTTEAAGPCLASLLRCGNREFIVLVLNSRSSKTRYKDTERLREWLQKKEQMGWTAVDQI